MTSLRVSLAVVVCAAAASAPAAAQTTPISIVNGTYFENFNSMGTGTPVYPTGWNGYKWGGGGTTLTTGSFITTTTNPAFTTNNGGLGTGTVYNYGGGVDPTDRALGSVGSTATFPGFGVVLINNTGRVLTDADVLISFRTEQWRTGSSTAANEFWTFQWFVTSNQTVDVNDITSTFSVEPALNINEIQTGTTTSAAIDGNAAGNFANVSGTIAGLIWQPGDRLILRWLDPDNTGTDSGMAVDDFNFTVLAPVPEPTTLALCGGMIAGFALLRRRAAA